MHCRTICCIAKRRSMRSAMSSSTAFSAFARLALRSGNCGSSVELRFLHEVRVGANRGIAALAQVLVHHVTAFTHGLGSPKSRIVSSAGTCAGSKLMSSSLAR